MVRSSKTSPGRKTTKVVVIINQKGGVGKTTTAFHIAEAAAEIGKRVLVIDVDTQGNMSQFLTGNLDIQKNVQGGSGVLFSTGSVPKDAPTPTNHDGIWLLHGHEELDQYDNDADVFERVVSSQLRMTLHSLDYDVVIIDTPPAVGVRHLAPLVWSDLAVIPMEPANSAVAGFQSVLESIDSVLELNPGLQWVGVLNRLNRSAKSHRAMEDMVREAYREKIGPALPSRTAVADAMQEDPAVPVWRLPGARRDVRDLWRDWCTSLVA